MTPIDWAGLAATSLAAAILQGATGFGFAVLATPFFLLFVAPAVAIQLIIIVTLALSAALLPGLHRAFDPRLLLRLALGGAAGLPLGLAGFALVSPILVRAAAGTAILAFAGILAASRLRRSRSHLAMSPGRDVAAGAIAGVMTALLGMSGPPVLIYLLLTGAQQAAVRATLLWFFVLSYAASLVAHIATVGVPRPTWIAAAGLIPAAWLGGLIGRRLGDRLGHDAFAALAIALLAAGGLYTVAAAAALAAG